MIPTNPPDPDLSSYSLPYPDPDLSLWSWPILVKPDLSSWNLTYPNEAWPILTKIDPDPDTGAWPTPQTDLSWPTILKRDLSSQRLTYPDPDLSSWGLTYPLEAWPTLMNAVMYEHCQAGSKCAKNEGGGHVLYLLLHWYSQREMRVSNNSKSKHTK